MRFVHSYAIVTGHIATLLLVGPAAVVFGTLLPLGGGAAFALIGAAAVGAGLVLIGVRMLRATESTDR